MRRGEAFECNACGALYTGMVDAEDCCPPEGRDVWLCENPRCKATDPGIHLNETGAGACVAEISGLCECGHDFKGHAVNTTFAGCYEWGCKCFSFSPPDSSQADVPSTKAPRLEGISV